MNNEEMGEFLHKTEMLEMDFLRENGIESASANLSDLKRLVQSMKKSDMKTNLMDCVERMELDLC